MKKLAKMMKSTRAQSMVEMALVLPLLLLILFGIIEFGIVLGSYMMIHDLARDGARAGVVGADNTAIVTQITSNALFLDTDSGHMTVIITPSNYSNRAIGDPLKVRIEYKQDIITPIISNVVGSPVEMSSEYVMRIEKT